MYSIKHNTDIDSVLSCSQRAPSITVDIKTNNYKILSTIKNCLYLRIHFEPSSIGHQVCIHYYKKMIILSYTIYCFNGIPLFMCKLIS